MKRIKVAVLGAGTVAELVAKRIRARKDLSLTASAASGDEPPAGTQVVVFVPAGQTPAGEAAARIDTLLRAGFDVVSTLPPEALAGTDLLSACRAGKTSFHGTGGTQSRLVSRFNRAFSAITRNIREVELIEERDVVALPAGDACADGCYAAGLHLLGVAVLGDRQRKAEFTSASANARSDDAAHRPRAAKALPGAEQRIVRRTLGKQLAYDSIWTQREGTEIPLRYRLNTVSADAIGHVTIDFHAGGGVHPADHLAVGGLLDAIRPVAGSKPGILHHDLDINQVQPNDCLAG